MKQCYVLLLLTVTSLFSMQDEPFKKAAGRSQVGEQAVSETANLLSVSSTYEKNAKKLRKQSEAVPMDTDGFDLLAICSCSCGGRRK